MRRIFLGLALLIGSVAHASTNVTITVTGPPGGDLSICSDAAGTSCNVFTVTSNPTTATVTLFPKPGCVMGTYTVTFSVPPAAALASDTATINVVAGPLVKLLVTTGKNANVPIKGGTTSIVVAGGDVCGNLVQLP